MSKKLTQEEVIRRFKEVHGNKYDYSKVNFKRSDHKVTIICRKHGEFSIKPTHHVSGSGCPKCAGRGLTHEELVQEFRDVHGDKYDYSLVRYKNSKTKIRIICPIHGEFRIEPTRHKRGGGCQKCGFLIGQEKNMMTRQEFIERSQKIHQNTDGDSLYGYQDFVYKGSAQAGVIYCKACKKVFMQKPLIHLQGKGCPDCGYKRIGDKKRADSTEVLSRMQNKASIYDFSKFVYTKMMDKSIVICSEHGEFTISAHHILHGRGCPKCAGRNRVWEEVLEEFKAIHGSKYDYTKVDFSNVSTPIRIKCPTHGFFFQTPSNHLRGQGCPRCRRSKGEARVACFLDKHNILYKPEYSFPDCKEASLLLFDFYLAEHNTLIEYDGIQHYKAIGWFGGEQALQANKVRDEIKNEYCRKNNINLLRIPYWEFDNIENILRKELSL